MFEQTCSNQWCKQPFTVTDQDIELLKKTAPVIGGKPYDFPLPTQCPHCRMQRRLAFRNERGLHRNTCALCKKSVISLYRQNSEVVVYCPDCWWSDRWDCCTYGRDIDFSQPIFEQISELMKVVPFQSNVVINSFNSEYNTACMAAKDCYMCQRVAVCENDLYCYLLMNSVWCVDCAYITRCQYCYECVDCWDCYDVKFSRLCKNCSNSAFCFDCIGCRNCIGCAGLRNADSMLFNRPCSKEELEEARALLRSYNGIQSLRDQFLKEILLKHPRHAVQIEQSEDTLGDCILKSKSVHQCFDIEECQNVSHSWGLEYCKDVLDGCFIYRGEICHEQLSVGSASFTHCCFGSFESHNLICCMQSNANTSDCFGSINCIGKHYCILNKQYTKEKYEELVPKIIDHMRQTGEWGEFFPVSISPFTYNETIAQEYFPLSKKIADDREWKWSDEEEITTVSKTIPASQLPDGVDGVQDYVVNTPILCKETGRAFRITKQEMDFYRKQQLPLPHCHPDERYRKRISQRNPKKFWDRNCSKCNISIQTTYPPDRPEIVYCEKCYLESVY